jgi:hypothetical protein
MMFYPAKFLEGSKTPVRHGTVSAQSALCMPQITPPVHKNIHNKISSRLLSYPGNRGFFPYNISFLKGER